MTLTYVYKMFTPRSHVMSGLLLILHFLPSLAGMHDSAYFYIILLVSKIESTCTPPYMADNQTIVPTKTTYTNYPDVGIQ